MKDKDELIKQAEDIGYAQTEEILKDIPFSTYDEILFVSKVLVLPLVHVLMKNIM